MLAALDEAAQRLGKQKNEIVIEAIEQFLADRRPEIGVFSLGALQMPPRDDLHLDCGEVDERLASR